MNTLDLTCLWIGRAVFYFGGSALSFYLLSEIAWRTLKRVADNCKIWSLFLQFIMDRRRSNDHA